MSGHSTRARVERGTPGRQLRGPAAGTLRVRRMTEAGVGHRQDEPIESFRSYTPTPRVRLEGALDRSFKFPAPVVGEAQGVEDPGSPASLKGLLSQINDLLRGTDWTGADSQGARQEKAPGRGVADPIRPLLAKLLVAGAVAQQKSDTPPETIRSSPPSGRSWAGSMLANDWYMRA